VQPWQQAWEFSKVLELFERLKPERILEIGIYKGGTLFQWLKRAPRGARVVAVDPGWVDPVWHHWATRLEKELHIVSASSTSASTRQLVGQLLPEIDFLFLDGDHHYEAVKADWQSYSPWVRPGGIVVLHDILYMPSETWVRVDLVWEEIKAGGYRTEEWYLCPDQGVYGTGVVYV
jgi:cephalosporin hydroxylase